MRPRLAYQLCECSSHLMANSITTAPAVAGLCNSMSANVACSGTRSAKLKPSQLTRLQSRCMGNGKSAPCCVVLELCPALFSLLISGSHERLQDAAEGQKAGHGFLANTFGGSTVCDTKNRKVSHHRQAAKSRDWRRRAAVVPFPSAPCLQSELATNACSNCCAHITAGLSARDGICHPTACAWSCCFRQIPRRNCISEVCGAM